MLRSMLAPVRWVVRYLFVLLVLFEEWGWEPLRRLMAAVARLPGLRLLEAWLKRLPPYVALATLLVPSLILLPVNLFAVWLTAQGHPIMGAAVLIGAKLAGTAVIAWLFQLIKPALMQLAWFAKWYGRWIGWKDAQLAWVRASAAWHIARRVKASAQIFVSRIKATILHH